MNWHSVTEQIIQIAEAAMLVLFAVEVIARTAMLTVTEVRRAWAAMRRESGE